MSGNIGPAGERGKTGDHGQRGDMGDTGNVGLTGATGRTGQRGAQGLQGLRGRPLSWGQALAMFLLIAAIGLILGFNFERQQHALELEVQKNARQQAQIQANSAKIAEERYQGCLRGVVIIEKFNQQMRDLADIERRNKTNPTLAKERIKAYEAGITQLPETPCRR